MTVTDAKIRSAWERWLDKGSLAHRYGATIQANEDDEQQFHSRALRRLQDLNVDPKDKSTTADLVRIHARYHSHRLAGLIEGRGQ